MENSFATLDRLCFTFQRVGFFCTSLEYKIQRQRHFQKWGIFQHCGEGCFH